MRDNFPGKILNWDEVHVRDTVEDTETGRKYAVISKNGNVIDCLTNEEIILKDADKKKYVLIWYPLFSKRAEEQSPPATLVTEEEIKLQKAAQRLTDKMLDASLDHLRKERKYPVSDVEIRLRSQQAWNEMCQAFIEFYKTKDNNLEVGTFSTISDQALDVLGNLKFEIKTYTDMKVNKKYKAYELLEFLKDKKNMFLKISEVVQPFDQKLMISFSSVTGEHEGIVISENNQAELIFNDHIYRLVQICKINKGLK